jgi:hypothetical protein
MVVQSRCGTLEYLSPLGVEMLIKLSMTCQYTTPDTTKRLSRTNESNLYQPQSGRTVATPLKKKTEGGVMDVLTDQSLVSGGLLSLVESSNPLRPLLKNQQLPEKPKMKRDQYGSKRIPKNM